MSGDDVIEKYLTDLQKHGFIANPYTSQSSAFIKADAVLKKLEDDATHGSGCYFELYEARLLRAARNFHDCLSSPSDREVFLAHASKRGVMFDDESIRSAEAAESECWEDINVSQD